MNCALADDVLQSKLGKFQKQTEFYDSNGLVLGVFTPADERERLRYERAKAQYSAAEIEELERSSQQREGLTTSKVTQRLRELGAG